MKFCPHCGGDLSAYTEAERAGAQSSAPAKESGYNQTKHWKSLIQLAEKRKLDHPTLEGMAHVESLKGIPAIAMGKRSSIIHLVLDREVVPSGGVLQKLARLEGRTALTPDQLAAQGYLLEEEDHVKMVDGFAVGKAYEILQYWGGERQYRRWHLEEPVKVNPSRNGDPFFMDDNMVAFGARWVDSEKIQEALSMLLKWFADGTQLHPDPIAIPLVLDIHWR